VVQGKGKVGAKIRAAGVVRDRGGVTMQLTDENGVPTVAGAKAMFQAMDEAKANRDYLAMTREEQAKAEAIAKGAARAGIPLASAGRVDFAIEVPVWTREGGTWVRRPSLPALVKDTNLFLIAIAEKGMDPEDFRNLWQAAARDFLKVARCVRVRVWEQAEV
jgi:hypothetical protein